MGDAVTCEKPICNNEAPVSGDSGTTEITQLEHESALSSQTPSIVWKAIIQKPVRLGENESLPIGRPWFLGESAPKPKLAETMESTVMLYKSILPNPKESVLFRPRTESKYSRRSTITRSIYGGLRSCQGQKFLKTVPMVALRFPPLQRSPYFEEFVRTRSYETLTASMLPGLSTHDSSSATTTEPLHTDTQVLEDGVLKKRNTIESIKSYMDSGNYSKQRHRRASVLSFDSVETGSIKTKRFIPFRPSVRKPGPFAPPLPFTPSIHRSLATLQSLDDGGDEDEDDDNSRRSRSEKSEDHLSRTARKYELEKIRLQTTINRPCQGGNFPGGVCPYVADMEDLRPGIEILDAKIKEYDLKLTSKSENADQLRVLYTETILKHPALRRLLVSKRMDALPKSLRHFVRLFSIPSHRNELDSTVAEQDAKDLQQQFCIQKEVKRDIALADTEHMWTEARIFTAELFSDWIAKTQPLAMYGQLAIKEFDNLLKTISKSVRSNNTIPTSPARLELCLLLATSVAFPKHATVVWAQFTEWMENLLSGLHSRERTVREETCYILAYIFTEPTLVQGIRQYGTLDICYDVTVAILQGIQLNPDSFLHFFCLLTLMIEGCPVFSTLKAIMELGPTISCALLNHLWPRLIYYALRYWHPKQFTHDRALLKVLNDGLERGYMRGISRKHAKLAQIQLSRRFKLLTKPTTIWLDEWKKFRS